MKHILCPTFIALLFVHCVQAAEVPFIELKGHTGFIRTIQFSTDGKRITTTGDSEIRLWDAESGKELYAITGQHHQLSRDGKKIALTSDAGTHIWDAELGKKICTLPEKFREFFFSPDRKKIMTWRDSNGPYQIWDAESGKELCTLTLQSENWSGYFPTFTPDGKKIRIVDGVGGITGNDSKIRFFDAETGKELELPARYNGFSPDGKKMFSWSDRSEVRIWDDETGKELFVLPGTFGGFSPDGKRVFTWNEGKTRIWDADSGEELYVLTGVYIKFSPDGKKIVTRSYDTIDGNDDETIWTYDAESYKELYTLKGKFVNFTRDGKTTVTSAKDRNTRLWDDESGKEFLLAGSYDDSSSDGKKIVTVAGNGTRVWDLESGKDLWLHGSFQYFSPGGTIIVMSTLEYDEQDMSYEIYYIYHTESGRELALTGEFSGFSPDGTKIVSVGGGTHIWDAETGKKLHTLTGIGGFSPDGKKIVTIGDNNTHVWDAESGKELHVFSGTSRGFTPDGRLMTTLRYGSRNDTIRTWDISAIMEDNQ